MISFEGGDPVYADRLTRSAIPGVDFDHASEEAVEADRVYACTAANEMHRGVKMGASVLAHANQSVLKRYSPVEALPGPSVSDDADALAKAAGDIGTTIFHPVGTTKMGRQDDETAVVDSRLRVIGVQGLRVIDASVMPTITSGNTNTPTALIAMKGATMMLEDARSR